MSCKYGTFSYNDMERAIRWIDTTGPSGGKIGDAIKFRNSLHAFLRDADRAQNVVPPVTIMAADTVEVLAPILDNFGDSQFNFGRLFFRSPSKYILKELITLDGLISQQLLNRQKSPILLLDPFVEELQLFRQSSEIFVRSPHAEIESSPFFELNSSQRKNILNWIGSSGTAEPQEWKLFRQKFLPDVSEKLLNSLARRSQSINSLDAYLKDGAFNYIRPLRFGKRSLFNHLTEKFDINLEWDEYVKFCSREDVIKRAMDIREVTLTLLLHARQKDRRSKEIKYAVASRDAMSFTTVDTFNRFLLVVGAQVRVELVSRSGTMHDVIGALPDNSIRVTVRHPLLLPDIYNFNRQSINRMAELVQRVDAVLASAIDIDSLETEYNADLHAEISKAATETVLVLKDRLIGQQTLENTSLLQGETKDDNSKIWTEIVKIFHQLEIYRTSNEDPYSTELFEDLAKRNLAVADFARNRVFGTDPNAYLNLIIFDFFRTENRIPPNEETRQPNAIDGFMPVEFLAIRATQGRFSRMFHIHSSRVRKSILDIAKKGNAKSYCSRQLVECALPISLLFKGLKTAFDSLAGMNDSQYNLNNLVYNLDSTLLISIAFAERGRLDTAIALSSTVLHSITSELRRGASRTVEPNQLREYLAFRELFLFRHYCERVMARYDYYIGEKRRSDSKGSISKNLARAQRDLDFATLMSEDAERCVNTQSSSSGTELIHDGRLKLAHFGGWLDQFVMVLKHEQNRSKTEFAEQKSIVTLIGNRMEVWTAAGFVKEIIFEAQSVARRRRAIPDTAINSKQLHQYLLHSEARCLQAALATFSVFMAYPISLPLHRLWLGDTEIEPERMLVFRDWQTWWRRYDKIVGENKFAMRLRPLLSATCETLLEASKLPSAKKDTYLRKGWSRFLAVKDPTALRAALDKGRERIQGSHVNLELHEVSDLPGMIGGVGFATVVRGALMSTLTELLPDEVEIS